MQILKGVQRAIIGLIRVARAVVQSIPMVARNRHRQTSEAERLDRIRNPLKYLGKN